MYHKNKRIIVSKQELTNYVEGYDIFNSLLLNLLADPDTEKDEYEITVYEYRPDLIAKDIYGSDSYLGILMMQARMTLPEFQKGKIIRYIPKSIIDNLLKSI